MCRHSRPIMPCDGRILSSDALSAQRCSLTMFLTVLIACRCSVLGWSLYRCVTVAQSVRDNLYQGIKPVPCEDDAVWFDKVLCEDDRGFSETEAVSPESDYFWSE